MAAVVLRRPAESVGAISRGGNGDRPMELLHLGGGNELPAVHLTVVQVKLQVLEQVVDSRVDRAIRTYAESLIIVKAGRCHRAIPAEVRFGKIFALLGVGHPDSGV